LRQQIIGDHIAVIIWRIDDHGAAVQTRETATTTGTVVVGGDQEFLVGVDGLSLKLYIDDSVLVVDHAAVDEVADTVNNIEVVSREAVVDQGLHTTGSWVDGIELTRRPLQPLCDLFTGQFHHFEVIGVNVQVCSG